MWGGITPPETLPKAVVSISHRKEGRKNRHVTVRAVVKKKRSFYGQADRKGWGVGGPSALTVSKCENFGPIFPIIKW